MPWLRGEGSQGLWGSSQVQLYGSFVAQGAVPGCKGAVPRWEAHGRLHVLVGALISCSTGDQSDFWVPAQKESLGLLSIFDL